MFQLGLLLLQLCSLSTLSDIYKLDSFQLYNGRMQTYLELASYKYGYKLMALVRNLLQYEPKDRIRVK
jgi:hypothetical protein